MRLFLLLVESASWDTHLAAGLLYTIGELELCSMKLVRGIPVGVHVRQGPTGSVSPRRNRQPTLLASFITIHELRTEFPGRVEANGDPVPNGPHLDRSFPLRARRSIQGVGGHVPDIADSIAGADETPAWCILGLAQADLVCEPSLFAWRVTRGPK